MGKKRIARRWYPVLIIAAILLVLFLFGLFPRLALQKKVDALATHQDTPRVSTMQVKPNSEPVTLILPSSAQAWHITPIWARVNGYLLQYNVDIGDRVTKGDLLAIIDTPETDAQVAEAEADLQNAIAVRDIATITRDRWQKLWDKNKEAVSKQEVDQYQANYTSAEALVVAGQKIVSRLTAQQQFKYIYAPFNGIITQRNVDIGSLIYGSINGAPQELFELAETPTVRFFVDVPQTYFRQIADEIECEVTIPQFPEKVFKGVVARYAKSLDPVARTLLTQVNVDNTEGLLYPGLFGRVKFIFKQDNVNFIVPTTAIIIRSGFPEIAIVDSEQTVALKKVQIGLDYGKNMQIVKGLEENDRIITIPSDAIVPGIKVEILQKNS